MAPSTRLPPFTVSTAVAVKPELVRVAAPSDVCPRAKETVPVGGAAPDAGVTVTDSWVVALLRMPAGLADEVRVVATLAGTMSVTVAEPVDPVNGEVG